MPEPSTWLREILRARSAEVPEADRREVARRIDRAEEVRPSAAGLSLGAVDWCDRDLAGLELAGSRLEGARLSASVLNGASLVLADLRGAELRRSHARGADFRGADLRGADLDEIDATGADLREADVRVSSARGAALVAARFEGATLPRLGSVEHPHTEGVFRDGCLARASFDLETVLRSGWGAGDVAAAAALGMIWCVSAGEPVPVELWCAYQGREVAPPGLDDEDEPF